MPRGPRLDAPGALHHVMVRGIEGSPIITDDDDRNLFLRRMGMAATGTGTTIFAWALMTNHAHLLLRSGAAGLSTFMRKFLTGYASLYNRRHQRQGHLFQNRYKSVLCEEDAYFLKLVSYIHLNPFRAGLVGSLDELSGYPWSGHASLINGTEADWQDRDYVLGHFGDREGSALKAYLAFVSEQMKLGKQDELSGGGLIRSAGGWSEVLSLRQRGELQFSDQRILGSGDFVEEALKAADEIIKSRVTVLSGKTEAFRDLDRMCKDAGVSVTVLQSGSRRRGYSEIRKVLVREFVMERGLTLAETARLLGISASAVNQILRRIA
ncbi:MAG: hypothetical protein HGB02_03335 [Chlorobiaceae bacterium]|nr:hypothetical protein [Chlorobiaceae bacterium]